jgi:hypothetical protein
MMFTALFFSCQNGRLALLQIVVVQGPTSLAHEVSTTRQRLFQPSTGCSQSSYCSAPASLLCRRQPKYYQLEQSILKKNLTASSM